RNLYFNYFLFKKGHQEFKGYSDSLSLTKKIAARKHYFFIINYLWAGKMYKEVYALPHKKSLQLNITAPELVYSGQKSKIEISVKNWKGKPVRNIDLTAYSITDKFD